MVRDKVYCTLTGQLMGIGVAAVKMHTDGKKFKKAKGTLIATLLSV